MQFIRMKSIIYLRTVRKYCAEPDSNKNNDETFLNFLFISLRLSYLDIDVEIISLAEN